MREHLARVHSIDVVSTEYQDEVRPLVIHQIEVLEDGDRKSTRLNSSHMSISYAVFCLKKKNRMTQEALKPQYWTFYCGPELVALSRVFLTLLYAARNDGFWYSCIA